MSLGRGGTPLQTGANGVGGTYVTLNFALYDKTQAGWLRKYFSFINFLKQGKGGWLDIVFTQLDLTLHVKYSESPKFTPLTYLWKEGVNAGKFKVKFREPVPII